MTSLFTAVSPGTALAMAGAALVMVLTPGPNMLYLVSRSVSQGRVAGLISLMGTGLGWVIYMLAANLGLAVVFVAVPWLYIGFKAAGVAYLGYLAWQVLRPGGRGVFETNEQRRDRPATLFRMGLVTNLLNPKAAVIYLALIPQFIVPDAGHTVLQGMVLGSIQIVVSLTVNGLFVLGAGTLAVFLATRPTWTSWQRRVTGTMLGGVALLLARDVPHRAQV